MRTPKPRHPGFHKREKPPRKPTMREMKALGDAPAPADGPVRLFLDDERPAPAGWTRVKTVAAFETALLDLADGRLKELALDWYLGHGVPDGHAAVAIVVRLMAERPGLFSDLETIWLQSSIRENAIKMARPLEDLLVEDTTPRWFDVIVGHPDTPRRRPRW